MRRMLAGGLVSVVLSSLAPSPGRAVPPGGSDVIATTAPTSSYYIAVRGRTAMRELGYFAGLDEWLYQEAVAGEFIGLPHRVVILAFGGQIQGGAEWGTRDFDLAHNNFLGNSEIAILAEEFIEGFRQGDAPYADDPTRWSTVAISTNNDLEVSGAAGSAWNSLVGRVQSYAAAYPGIIVRAGNDIEIAFHESSADVLAWAANVDSYLDFGDAAGCPLRELDSVSQPTCQTPGDDPLNPHINSWPVRDRYQLAWGNVNSQAFPAIYVDPQALQWQALSEYGARASIGAISFSGVLAQTARCAQLIDEGKPHPECAGNNNPPEAQWELSLALLSSPYTAGTSEVPTASDIQFFEPPVGPVCLFIAGTDVCN